MRALTVRRPWAALIVSGHKPTENRSWPTSWRGLLVIHAGQRWEPAGAALAAAQGVPMDRAACPLGYLGTVRLVDVHEAAGCCAPWGHPTGWHWTLDEPGAFAVVMPGPGRLGLYRPPTEVIRSIITRDDRGGVGAA